MIKSQEEVLHNLKALFLSAIAHPASIEFRRGHILALLCVAQQWDVAGEFLQFVRQHKLFDNQPFILKEQGKD